MAGSVAGRPACLRRAGPAHAARGVHGNGPAGAAAVANGRARPRLLAVAGATVGAGPARANARRSKVC